ncbi:MAG: hypothetical protein ABIT83_23390 [Massilia sp.]
MEERVARLEEFVVETRERLTKIEARLDQTVENLSALKVEMHRGFADMIKWVVGTAIALGATGITVITFVLNHASPKTEVGQQPPIIIQMPGAAKESGPAKEPGAAKEPAERP